MGLDNLQDIRLFNQVVRSQGFTAAANILQLPVNKAPHCFFDSSYYFSIQ